MKGNVTAFRSKKQQGRTDTHEANETIKPLIKTMMQMNPGDLTDFCRAVCESVQYIERSKEYRYFSNSTDLACLIGVNYIYNTTSRQQIRTSIFDCNSKSKDAQQYEKIIEREVTHGKQRKIQY